MIKGPKTILYGGTGEIPRFLPNTKVSVVEMKRVLLCLTESVSIQVIFHFRTEVYENGCQKVVDDSKKANQPMELIVGKKFKLEAWEDLLKTMRIGEISQIKCDKSILPCYVFLSCQYRKFAKVNKNRDQVQSPSCCGLAMKGSVGHLDLDELMKNPSDLLFTIELIEVKENDSYEKELWQLSDDDQNDLVRSLRKEGNHYYESKDYSRAAEMYSKALGIIENLMLKEKPNEEEWNALDQLRIPFFLNLSQCKLFLGDYYEAIQHCSEVIKRDPKNVKAYFRRAKAHMNASNFAEARSDYDQVRSMDQSLSPTIEKLVRELNNKERMFYQKEKSMYVGKLFT